MTKGVEEVTINRCSGYKTAQLQHRCTIALLDGNRLIALQGRDG
jgi:hypothetical protein